MRSRGTCSRGRAERYYELQRKKEVGAEREGRIPVKEGRRAEMAGEDQRDITNCRRKNSSERRKTIRESSNEEQKATEVGTEREGRGAEREAKIAVIEGRRSENSDEE